MPWTSEPPLWKGRAYSEVIYATACPLIFAWSLQGRLLEGWGSTVFFFTSDTVSSTDRFEPCSQLLSSLAPRSSLPTKKNNYLSSKSSYKLPAKISGHAVYIFRRIISNKEIINVSIFESFTKSFSQFFNSINSVHSGGFMNILGLPVDFGSANWTDPTTNES